MILLAMTMAVALLAALAWCCAAFLLHWRQDARSWATILVPAAIATLAISIYMGVWTPDPTPTREEAGWRAVFLAASFLGGSFALFATLPVWYLMENRWGGRAR